MQEYRCNKCQSKFEVAPSCGCSATEVKCPKCGGTEAEKLENRSGKVRDFFRNFTNPT
ncbi:MAG: FmdB family zinc ribbon protein [Dehalococcoidia bacterium]